jgi:hypothetical protein
MADRRKFHELTLTRGTKRDVMSFRLPTYPDRLHLIRALAAAAGRADETVQEPNVDDAVAVYLATLGLCWPTPLPASFRGLRRDVVAYGEHVVTELIDQGYGGATELAEAGQVLFQWMQSITFPDDAPSLTAEVSAEAGFSEAPADLSTAGAR